MSEQTFTIRREDYEEILGMIEAVEDELAEVKEELEKLKRETSFQ